MSANRTTIAAVVVWILAIGAGSAEAFNPQPEPPLSLPFGITVNDVAIVNAVYAPGSEVSGVQPEPFVVGIGFYDARGRVVAQSIERVGLGEVVSLRISGRELGLRGTNRATLYGVVQCLGALARRAECARSIGASVELVGAEDGRTRVVVPLVPAILQVLGGQ